MKDFIPSRSKKPDVKEKEIGKTKSCRGSFLLTLFFLFPDNLIQIISSLLP